jgi:hypothetical protein
MSPKYDLDHLRAQITEKVLQAARLRAFGYIVDQGELTSIGPNEYAERAAAMCGPLVAEFVESFLNEALHAAQLYLAALSMQPPTATASLPEPGPSAPLKRDPSAMTPWEALVEAVDDNDVVRLMHGVSGDDYLIEFDIDGDGFVRAPSLELAVRALAYLDEGEQVTLDEAGRATCDGCGGRGRRLDPERGQIAYVECSECNGRGDDPSPPKAWPKGGIGSSRT